MQLRVAPLRDQITAPARTILLMLLGAAAVVFIIACSNVANLILARSVRREGELAVRAALGASRGALRRTLLAESLVLCGAGAVLGVALARPLVAVVAQFAARFSVRAHEVTVDASLLWVGAGLAMAAAVLLAYIPRLPSTHAPTGLGLASGSLRITPGTNRRLRAFAVAQIAFSFVLLVGAGMLLAALIAMQSAHTGYNLRQVLAIDLPTTSIGARDAKEIQFYRGDGRAASPRCPACRASRSATSCPGATPVRWARASGSRSTATCARTTRKIPTAACASSRPASSRSIGVPLIDGRDFTPTIVSRQRSGRDRQPERRAAAVSERLRVEPSHVVDRGAVRQTRPPPHRRRGRRCG